MSNKTDKVVQREINRQRTLTLKATSLRQHSTVKTPVKNIFM